MKIDETFFFFTYGIEAVISVELQVLMHWVQFNSEAANKEKLKGNLDALNETKDKAHLQTATYQSWLAKYYNQKVKEITLRASELVLRRL